MMKKILLSTAILTLAACNPFEQTPIEGFQPQIMVAASSPDYATADVVFIGRTEEQRNVVIEQRIHTTDPSDIAIGYDDNRYYRIGRSGYDNITQVILDEKNSTVSLGWQYSVKHSSETDSPNPYGILTVNTNKAYLTRNDAATLWVINPSATNETEFLVDEVDLSMFSVPDTPAPHMSDMTVVGDKLFVLLTRLTGTGWSKSANESSAVAVIDIATNEVIDTDSTVAGVQAIEVGGVNGAELAQYNNHVYVAATGNPWGAGTAEKYSGGIFSIDADNYDVELVLDDGNDNAHPYGNITNIDIAADGDIYFVGSQGWGDDAVYVLKRNDTVATALDLGAGQFNIADIKNNFINLYVAVHAQSSEPFNSAGLKVVNRSTHKVSNMIEMTYNPTQIEMLF